MAIRIVGYILILAGLVAVAIGAVPQLNTLLAIPIPAELTDLYLIGGGIVLLVIGALFLKMSRGRGMSSTKGMEVPIYRGRNVVGYRRN